MTTNIYNMTDTWNAIGTTFDGIKMNFTDGLGGAPVGAAASRFLRLQNNGTDVFSVNSAGSGIFESTLYAPIHSSDGEFENYTTAAAAKARTTALRVTLFGPNASGMALAATYSIAWSSNNPGSGDAFLNKDVFLLRDAAAILAQRDGTNPQTFRIYNTYTDASNYERLNIGWNTTANTLLIESVAAGTGTARPINIQTTNVFKCGSLGNHSFWTVGDACNLQVQFNGNGVVYFEGNLGHLKWNNDNTGDIGASGANRPRNIYVAGTGNFGGNLSLTGTNAAMFIDANGVDGRWVIQGQTDNSLAIYSDSLNIVYFPYGYIGLQFGGTTTAFPAIARNNQGLQFKLADDSRGTFYKSTVMTLASLSASVATAVSAGSGAQAYITDGNVPVFTVTVAGGGTTPTPVYSDGTQWRAG